MSLQTREPSDHITHTTEQAAISTVAADTVRACLQVCGEVDAALAPTLDQYLAGHLDAGRRYLRLELSGVTFMDTTALRVIVAAHHRALRSRGTLILTGVRNPVSRLLALTRLDRVLFVSGPRSDLDAAAMWN
ncbi:MAG: hypothetical protein JWO57_3749 [Pseudonocardiales bacterium]|nr:hypothetical protein [Pseudonocardiales bacterium]